MSRIVGVIRWLRFGQRCRLVPGSLEGPLFARAHRFVPPARRRRARLSWARR